MYKFMVEGGSIADVREKLRLLLVSLSGDQVKKGDCSPFQRSNEIAHVRLDRWIKERLLAAGIETLSQVEALNAKSFTAIEGLGHSALRKVNALLDEYGYRIVT